MQHPGTLSEARPRPEMLESMRRRIAALGLDLSGLTVVTEAATGAYACTAPIAAMAGARVHAVARDTRRYGRFEDAARATMDLAKAAGVADRITVTRALDPEVLRSCDIITNSGHLRPITAGTIAQLPPRAVLALMFEAWEFRGGDFDLQACRDRGIRVAAVNERHPDVGVFPFLGPLCVRLIEEAGVVPAGAAVTLLCDNPFAPFIERGLIQAGVGLRSFARVADVVPGPADVVVIALDPFRNAILGEAELAFLAAAAPGALLAQFWGDVDRETAAAVWPGSVWPPAAPSPGHMAVLLDALGHEPVVRLQAGGLKAAEIAFRNIRETGEAIAVML